MSCIIHAKDARKIQQLSYMHSITQRMILFFVILHLAFFLKILYNYTIVLINNDFI